jgi:hypothetical protein
LSDNHDLPKKQTEGVLGDLVTLTTRHLKKGDKNPPDRPRHSPGGVLPGWGGTLPPARRSRSRRARRSHSGQPRN